jgi:hypothetical protein
MYVWNGLLFLNEHRTVKGEQDNELVQTVKVMVSMAKAVTDVAVEVIASRKLGEVFKALTAEELTGLRRLLNYACILRSKPRKWDETSEGVIINTDRKSFYMGQMLISTLDQFEKNVNSGLDRDKLKKLVALIRAKRELKKDHPGSKMVGRVLRRLEAGNSFPMQESN